MKAIDFVKYGWRKAGYFKNAAGDISDEQFNDTMAFAFLLLPDSKYNLGELFSLILEGLDQKDICEYYGIDLNK